MPVVAATFLVALVLAAVHVFGIRLRFLDSIPRSRWLSAAGGVSVAYVFVHLLPELGAHQGRLEEELDGGLLGLIESHAYLMALGGLVLFYGLERLAKQARRRRTGEAEVFRLHLAAFALYNVLIGYLLLNREETGPETLFFYAVAMILHFVVNDRGLDADHGQDYRRLGRWVLAVAVLGGWALGQAIEISDVAIAVLFALLAGGVVLNVLKEELPEERESRFGAFLAGSAAYAALLLTL
ncbi:MAG TPA: hypothetical protein VFO41_03135 [Alphaproteobacteria bacterium]|nr:hypothetical protein [Alphaproteobacteria bacterium]